ncbi:hypothetical protein V8C86DRAFT_2755178 [Haematococcus lacustris]
MRPWSPLGTSMASSGCVHLHPWHSVLQSCCPNCRTGPALGPPSPCAALAVNTLVAPPLLHRNQAGAGPGPGPLQQAGSRASGDAPQLLKAMQQQQLVAPGATALQPGGRRGGRARPGLPSAGHRLCAAWCCARHGARGAGAVRQGGVGVGVQTGGWGGQHGLGSRGAAPAGAPLHPTQPLQPPTCLRRQLPSTSACLSPPCTPHTAKMPRRRWQGGSLCPAAMLLPTFRGCGSAPGPAFFHSTLLLQRAAVPGPPLPGLVLRQDRQAPPGLAAPPWLQGSRRCREGGRGPLTGSS